MSVHFRRLVGLGAASSAATGLALMLWVTAVGASRPGTEAERGRVAVRGGQPLATSLLPRSGEMPGFRPRGSPIVTRSIQAYVARAGLRGTAAKNEATALHDEGFAIAAFQNQRGITPNTGAIGISEADVFGSETGATRHLARLLPEIVAAQGRGVSIRRFVVKGIPGAVGFVGRPKGIRGTAVNLVFATGRCTLLVGDVSTTADLEASVVSAARTLDRRARSSCS